jgi:hypothetical protein
VRVGRPSTAPADRGAGSVCVVGLAALRSGRLYIVRMRPPSATPSAVAGWVTFLGFLTVVWARSGMQEAVRSGVIALACGAGGLLLALVARRIVRGIAP